MLAELDDPDGAEALLRRGLATDPFDPALRASLVLRLLDRDALAEATVELATLGRQTPGSVVGHIARARPALHEDRVLLADREALIAATADPGLTDPLLLQAAAAVARGDPTAARRWHRGCCSTRLRDTDLIRRPFADVALGGRIATGDRAAQRTGTFDVEAFGRPGVLVALAVLGETQARDGGRSNSDGDGNALQAFFGLQASERDALVATLTLGGGRQQLPDQEDQFPGGLDQVTFGEEAAATLGWSHRLGPRNRLMLQAAASHEERRLDLAGFDVELIDQRSRGASLELRHLLGLGAADLSWGLVAGALDAAGAAAIVLDIVMPEPSDPAEDEALARAIAGAGPVVLAGETATVEQDPAGSPSSRCPCSSRPGRCAATRRRRSTRTGCCAACPMPRTGSRRWRCATPAGRGRSRPRTPCCACRRRAGSHRGWATGRRWPPTRRCPRACSAAGSHWSGSICARRRRSARARPTRS